MQTKYKGRGTASNRPSRFLDLQRTELSEHDDSVENDHWLRGPATSILRDHPRTAISRNDSPDVPFDRSINLYQGCEHGCPYCYARPTHAYAGLSPGLDFETKLFKEWLLQQVPQRAERIMSLIRDLRGGRENSSEFGRRMRGVGPYADIIDQRFRLVCRRLGLTRNPPGLNCSAFKLPGEHPAKSIQGDLFGQ